MNTARQAPCLGIHQLLLLHESLHLQPAAHVFLGLKLPEDLLADSWKTLLVSQNDDSLDLPSGLFFVQHTQINLKFVSTACMRSAYLVHGADLADNQLFGVVQRILHGTIGASGQSCSCTTRTIASGLTS